MWPEIFNYSPESMESYLRMMRELLAAAEQFADAEQLMQNMEKYILTFEDVHQMGFCESVDIEIVCRIIVISRADSQSVVNALLTLHIDNKS